MLRSPSIAANLDAALTMINMLVTPTIPFNMRLTKSSWRLIMSRLNIRANLCGLVLSILPASGFAEVLSYNFNGFIEQSYKIFYTADDSSRGIIGGSFDAFSADQPFSGTIDIDDTLFGAITTFNNSVYLQPLNFQIDIRPDDSFNFKSTAPCLGFQTADNDSFDNDPARILTADQSFDRISYSLFIGLTPCDISTTPLHNNYVLSQISFHVLDIEELNAALPSMLSSGQPSSDINALSALADDLFIELIFQSPSDTSARNLASVIGRISNLSQVPEPPVILLLSLGLVGALSTKHKRCP
jgi:hypothetical protein